MSLSEQRTNKNNHHTEQNGGTSLNIQTTPITETQNVSTTERKNVNIHMDLYIDDILALPDGVRAELIDGKLYYMSAPSRRHQQILMKLGFTIYQYFSQNNGKCEVNLAPFAVFLNNDCYDYVEPDITVICDPNKLDEQGCNGAPDWIIEITSQSSLSMDYNTKLFKYRISQVREYWIVDPMKSMVTVYNFEHDTLSRHSFSDTVKVRIYDNLYIDFSQINI